MDKNAKLREFKKSLPKPKHTEGVVWAHSLRFCKDNIKENLKGVVDSFGTDREIAVTPVGEIDQSFEYGMCGVYLKGICTVLSCGENFSIYLKDGERVPLITDRSLFIEDYNDLSLKGDNYCECYLRPTEIVGFWVKEEKYLKFIRNEAIKLNVPIRMLTE